MRRAAFALGLALALALAAAGPAPAAKHPKPKLSVKSVSEPPALAKPDASFEVTGRVANKGKRRGKARVKLTLRKTARGEAEAKLGSTKLRVRKHRRKRFSTVATIPSEAAFGSYLVVACVKRHGHHGRERCAASDSYVRLAAEPAPSPPPVFSPGARTLGDPLLPQIGNGGYDARHYAIDLDYDPDANVFDSATTTMTATATQNLSELSLDFQDLDVRG